MTVKVDWNNAYSLHEAYWNYRIIASSVPWAKRSPNMPSELTEAIVCLCTNAELIDEGHGDILLPNGEIGEVKGTSSYENDLSSFSPSSNFDKLFFVHMDLTSHNIYHVYDLNRGRNDLLQIKVNRNSTFEDHARENRRPRFSILDEIIKPENIGPTWKVDMLNRMVI